MVLCGTKNGSSIYGITVKNLLSTFIFKSVECSEHFVFSSLLIKITTAAILVDYFLTFIATMPWQ